MALILPVDLQLWLRWRAARAGCSVEDALLDALYDVQRREQQEEIAQAQARGGDLWAGVEQEATAKAAWQARRRLGPAEGRPG